MIKMMNWRVSLFTAAWAVCASPSPALARDWPKTAGWDIIEGDDYCAMALEYEGKGDTILTVGKFLDGHAIVIVTNYGWSAKKGDVFDLKFFVGDQSFGGGKSIGTGESYERKGFITSFEADFFPAFAAGGGLKIYKGNTLVDNLTLDGSASASATVNRCVAHVRGVRAAEERERNRFAHIPDDPFAEAKTEPVAAEVRGRSENWVSVDDYPPSSLRAGEEGTTQVKYTVNAIGRVENCIITSSSGSSALDRATCSSLTRRGRFDPSVIANGASTGSVRTYSYTWSLPKE